MKQVMFTRSVTLGATGSSVGSMHHEDPEVVKAEHQICGFPFLWSYIGSVSYSVCSLSHAWFIAEVCYRSLIVPRSLIDFMIVCISLSC